MIVAIDGPAGSGKSTTSRRVADRLSFLYLDTGAMYRAATLAVLSKSCDVNDDEAVVFPDADFKFFMVADVAERAKRRKKDLAELGIEQTVEEIVEDLKRRDRLDSSRAISPLEKADEAVEVDTTAMTMDEQVDLIVSLVRERSERKEIQTDSD